jgi:polysaccharide biosynthesis protein PslG
VRHHARVLLHRRLPAPTLFACLAAVAALLLSAAGAAAATGPAFGVQGGGVTGAEPAGAYASELDRDVALGARQVRFEVSWAALEPRAAGDRDPAVVASIDDFVAAAAKRGLKPILFIDRTPCWASSAPESDRHGCSGSDANRFDVWRYAPADPATAAPVFAFLAQRYGDRLAAIQLWNEPDQSNQKYWNGPDKIGRYVTMAKASYAAIKAVAPQLPVLAGSFVGTDGRWLEAAYKAGLKGNYDGVAVQFYDLPLLGLKVTRAMQKKYGDTAPLWMTEFGFTSCAGANGKPVFLEDHPCVTRRVQAENLADLMTAIRRTSWVRSAIMYSLIDESRAYQFGVFDRQGKRKPAYAPVRRAMHGGGSRTLRKAKPRLRGSGNHMVLTGTAPGIDIYTLEVSVGGRLRYRANLRTTNGNRLAVKLPAALGTRGLHATLRANWTGKRVTVR